MGQIYLKALYKWSQLKFNILKRKHLQLGPVYHIGFYYLTNTEIDPATTHEDLGVLFDEHLKFRDQVTAKANHILVLVFDQYSSGPIQSDINTSKNISLMPIPIMTTMSEIVINNTKYMYHISYNVILQ